MDWLTWQKETRTSDRALSEATRQVDPWGRGLSMRTLRYLRAHGVTTVRSAALLSLASGGTVELRSFFKDYYDHGQAPI